MFAMLGQPLKHGSQVPGALCGSYGCAVDNRECQWVVRQCICKRIAFHYPLSDPEQHLPDLPLTVLGSHRL
ncbi:hypothetical protein D3C76_1570540 [compost metagenome]